MNRKTKQVSLEPYGYTLVRREPMATAQPKPIRTRDVEKKSETPEPKPLPITAPVTGISFTPVPAEPAQAPPKKNNSAGCAALFIAVVVGIIMLAIFAPHSSGINGTSYADTDHDAGMACIMAEKLIKPQLKAPTTAEFDYGDCKTSATHSGNTWTLRTYVDADNSFGAHIRTHFVAQITNVPPSDTWRLENVTFDEP
jgi:hypothetical protein